MLLANQNSYGNYILRKKDRVCQPDILYVNRDLQKLN